MLYLQLNSETQLLPSWYPIHLHALPVMGKKNNGSHSLSQVLKDDEL